MYCTREAEEEIRRRLSPYGPRGIHFLDNGNYHYVTKFFAGKIREPFSLVLYDHHSDMQKPLFPGMTSCGSWAGELLLHHPYLRQMPLAVLEKLLLEVFVHQQVIGVDICGECSLLEPLQELMEDEKINRLPMSQAAGSEDGLKCSIPGGRAAGTAPHSRYSA